jgi:hypothetical protein
LGLKPQRLAADSAYGSAPTLNWIVNEKRIAPHIPVIDMSTAGARALGFAGLAPVSIVPVVSG